MAGRSSKVKVWDWFVRAGHWGIGLLVLGSFLTSEHDALVHAHARIGLAIAVVVVLRIAWGFVGPAPARFRAFVRGPRAMAAYARALATGRPPLHLSHNPLGGAMAIALLAVLLACIATGLAVYLGPEFGGPLTGVLGKRAAHAVKEVHEATTGALVGLLALHVAGVLFSSWRERQNLVLGMITGFKRPPVAALALAAGIATAAPAHAAAPIAPELLREYAAQARRERPAFSGFSAEEGRKLYFAEHAQDGGKVSCASCHSPSPRGQGRTPAGKIVDPLAPAANPARFTDRADVEKWFKRNCKQVIGRECTAEEKGNFVTWLLGA